MGFWRRLQGALIGEEAEREQVAGAGGPNADMGPAAAGGQMAMGGGIESQPGLGGQVTMVPQMGGLQVAGGGPIAIAQPAPVGAGISNQTALMNPGLAGGAGYAVGGGQPQITAAPMGGGAMGGIQPGVGGPGFAGPGRRAKREAEGAMLGAAAAGSGTIDPAGAMQAGMGANPYGGPALYR